MLPLHSHPPNRRHMTICVKGRLFCHGENFKWWQVLKPGDVFTFPEDEPHCVVGLDDDTVFVQVNLTPSLIPDTEADDKYMSGLDGPSGNADLATINAILGAI